jgi:hypothetical protein
MFPAKVFPAKSLLPSKSLLQQKLFWILLTTLLSLLCVSCGSSSVGNQDLSPAQAEAISQQVVTALQGALASTESGFTGLQSAHPSIATLMHEATPSQASDCTINSNGETCNIPITYTGPCPGGGTIGVSGDLDFTLNNSGGGTDSTSITVTPTNCAVSNLTINGDPNVTVTTQVSFADDQLEFPLTLTERGAVSYGPKPSGTCSLNVALTINSQSSCTISGTACGQPVSGSC